VSTIPWWPSLPRYSCRTQPIQVSGHESCKMPQMAYASLSVTRSIWHLDGLNSMSPCTPKPEEHQDSRSRWRSAVSAGDDKLFRGIKLCHQQTVSQYKKWRNHISILVLFLGYRGLEACFRCLPVMWFNRSESPGKLTSNNPIIHYVYIKIQRRYDRGLQNRYK